VPQSSDHIEQLREGGTAEGVHCDDRRVSAPSTYVSPTMPCPATWEIPEPVRSMHEIRYRRFREELNELADRLSAKEVVSPAVARDQIIRVLAVVAMLLSQHHVNKWGQCKLCPPPRWNWKVWRRRPSCTVYRTVSFVMGQNLDEVWWQLLESVGKESNLLEVREWIKDRALDNTCAVCGERLGDD
jgi:hypothetical protein